MGLPGELSRPLREAATVRPPAWHRCRGAIKLGASAPWVTGIDDLSIDFAGLAGRRQEMRKHPDFFAGVVAARSRTSRWPISPPTWRGRWGRGAHIERFGFASDRTRSPATRSSRTSSSAPADAAPRCWPLVDGELAVAGRHPTRSELARWAGPGATDCGAARAGTAAEVGRLRSGGGGAGVAFSFASMIRPPNSAAGAAPTTRRAASVHGAQRASPVHGTHRASSIDTTRRVAALLQEPSRHKPCSNAPAEWRRRRLGQGCGPK